MSTDELVALLPSDVASHFLARLQVLEEQKRYQEEFASEMELQARGAAWRCIAHTLLALLAVLIFCAATFALVKPAADEAEACLSKVSVVRRNISSLEEELYQRRHLQALSSMVQWASFTLESAPAKPEVIRFELEGERASGLYRRELEANDQPVWKKEHDSLYLYSGLSGFWYIGDEAVAKEGFQASRGYFHSGARHKGAMPDKVASVWRSWNGSAWVKNSKIQIEGLGALGQPLPDPECRQDQKRLQQAADELDQRLKSVQAQEIEWARLRERLYRQLTSDTCSPALEAAMAAMAAQSCTGPRDLQLPAWRRGSALPLCNALSLVKDYNPAHTPAEFDWTTFQPSA